MNRDEVVAGWLMALPAMILVLTFLIVPFFMAFGLSFTNQRLISPNPTKWVGTANFRKLLTLRTLRLEPLVDEATGEILRNEDGEIEYPKIRDYTRNNPDYPRLNGLSELRSFYRDTTRVVLLAGDALFVIALLNTLLFVAVVVPIQGGLALLLALLLNRPLKGINVYRTAFFMPVVVSMVVVSLLWRFIYDGQNGLLNTVLGQITFGNFRPIDWLGNTRTALGAILAMSVWQSVGFHMVIWLAGLQNIPTSRYEAASIDGVNVWQRFRYITWPGLRNTAIFIFVVITMQAFGVFTQVSVMTNGGPLDATQTIIFQAVVRGYNRQDIAEGSAISVVYFILVLAISLVQRRLTRERIK